MFFLIRYNLLKYRYMKAFFTFVIITFLFVPISFSQEFPYLQEFSASFTSSEKENLPKECFQFAAQKQLTFNFSTADIRNNTKISLVKSLKPYKPASEDSIKILEKKLTGKYPDAETEYKIAMQYYGLRNQEFFDKHIQLAYDYCEQSIEKQPDSSRYYILKVQILNFFGQTQNAEEVYKLMIKNMPEELTAYLMLSMSYMQTGRFSDADRLLNDGINRFPQEESFYFYIVLNEFFKLASTSDILSDKYMTETPLAEMFRINKFAEAAKKYKKNFKFVQTYKLTEVFLVFFKAIQSLEDVANLPDYKPDAESLKKINELKAYFQKALKSKKRANDYMLYYALGALEVAEGNVKASIISFEKACADRLLYADVETTSTEDLYGNLFSANILSGDTLAAIKVLKTKCELKPSASEFNLLALTYLDINDFSAAEQTLAKAFSIGYYDVKTVRAAAIMYMMTNQTELAQEYIAEIFKVSPDDFETLLIAGAYSAIQDDVSAAYSYFEKAYSLQPDNTDLQNLADIIFKRK